ncbi:MULTISPECIES: DUF1778 domain-containing protein [Testudinibacter]|uniref:DUF1778 domain-containing protein n=1 Tax=Testudinibacter aquarius TaxID=1524974 RepID=A0A4R3Y7N5_9PAST|nr:MULTISPECIES: DUF1778 domain-containing protein [Testudinibacter]TNH03529.1 DUF1778 domain-containing protein [Pasteurellaceae bacterium Phil31]KAE9527959.1 hypothetical protein A1D24_01705 [Testudinibacter aquarius]TCV86564.1 uncharacterized protein (DUF1778 family) [Testudinibacter aquarius]TNG93555.1 DUF1778 domain-containing protein [Testudinibacter aquarius]TNH07545.1 DUF1778 domain-containing protein [Testudinibacter sp. TR-2022]
MHTTATPRITARIDQDTQSLLLQAAKLAGITSINSFVVNAAVEKAKEILQAENLIKLNRESSLKLLSALDNPDMENQKLMQAFEEHLGR